MTQDLIKIDPKTGVALFTAHQATLVRTMLCPQATDMELAFFAQFCALHGLNPFLGQVHLVRRKQKDGYVAKPEIPVTGMLSMAEETGLYLGRTPYQWLDREGNWHEVWTKDESPTAARVGVHRRGAPEPIWGVADWKSYAAKTNSGDLMTMWKKFGPRMIAKCALALALREAVPQKLAGVYSVEEMDQAGTIDGEVIASSIDDDQLGFFLSLAELAEAESLDLVASNLRKTPVDQLPVKLRQYVKRVAEFHSVADVTELLEVAETRDADAFKDALERAKAVVVEPVEDAGEAA